MSGGVNKVILVGFLGQDPEVREAGNGSVCQLSVATNESWTDKKGAKQEGVEWHRVAAWGKLGEACAQHLAKGRQVYVEGKLQTRTWEDKDGNKRYTTEIVAQTVVFLGGRGEGQGGQRREREERHDDRGRRGGYQGGYDGSEGYGGGYGGDDDIPF